jgi:hypothetical protein
MAIPSTSAQNSSFWNLVTQWMSYWGKQLCLGTLELSKHSVRGKGLPLAILRIGDS